MPNDVHSELKRAPQAYLEAPYLTPANASKHERSNEAKPYLEMRSDKAMVSRSALPTHYTDWLLLLTSGFGGFLPFCIKRYHNSRMPASLLSCTEWSRLVGNTIH